MALFSKNSHSGAPDGSDLDLGDPRIRNAGRWPVRVTDFFLAEPYDQPPVDYLEVFYVHGGSFLHDSDAGKQTLREGSLIVSHPHNRQALKHTEDCHLTRVRFLPEWLVPDFHSLIASEFTVAAIVGQQFFELPDRESIYVFSARPERQPHLVSDLDLLRRLLEEGAAGGVLTRATLVKFLLQVGEEFEYFLRHKGGLSLPPECHRFFGPVEARLNGGDAPRTVRDELISADEADAFEPLFKKSTGLSPDDYLLRRRVDHAAYRLLTSEDRTKAIATELGFADSAELTRHFEARYRISPAVYRQKFSPLPPPRAGMGAGA